jgi:hypothetical protein
MVVLTAAWSFLGVLDDADSHSLRVTATTCGFI